MKQVPVLCPFYTWGYRGRQRLQMVLELTKSGDKESIYLTIDTTILYYTSCVQRRQENLEYLGTFRYVEVALHFLKKSNIYHCSIAQVYHTSQVSRCIFYLFLNLKINVTHTIFVQHRKVFLSPPHPILGHQVSGSTTL